MVPPRPALIRRPFWHLPEHLATPEQVWLSRRQVLTGAGALAAVLAFPRRLRAASDEPVATPEDIAISVNNFVEFSTSKKPGRAAQRLVTRPWTVTVDGEVEQPLSLGLDDLVKKLPIEDRLYRHRCVETWALVVPWRGFAFHHLAKLARPKANARYVKFTTFHNPAWAPRQKPSWFSSMPWPYSEGLTIAEALHGLTFIATGAYGRDDLANVMGAPLRLVVPWKYGFKSAKSIDRITFLAEKPTSFWEELQGDEYGFWANINPKVDHPRWSQAEERQLGTEDYYPTRLYNGYAEAVAPLYAGLHLPDEVLFR
ncbi:MAG TPA: protein-methionine-sulfoxide reductase catalytic subunit MsrP [Aestuariivirga sp.]|nr:protein-methionine-sulfoxide reductase catalytic subunit MsrP [Aestuariivirga sp.]